MSDDWTPLLLVPPTVPQVDEQKKPVLYTAQGKPLARVTGFRGKS